MCNDCVSVDNIGSMFQSNHKQLFKHLSTANIETEVNCPNRIFTLFSKDHTPSFLSSLRIYNNLWTRQFKEAKRYTNITKDPNIIMIIIITTIFISTNNSNKAITNDYTKTIYHLHQYIHCNQQLRVVTPNLPNCLFN